MERFDINGCAASGMVVYDAFQEAFEFGTQEYYVTIVAKRYVVFLNDARQFLVLNGFFQAFANPIPDGSRTITYFLQTGTSIRSHLSLFIQDLEDACSDFI
jgi:hypothetical protein